MSAAIKRIPEGYHTITPHLVVRDVNKAIEFYQRAFAAEELTRATGPDGRSIMHAELKIGDSRLMLCDEYPDWGVRSPLALGGSAVALHVYVQDADAAFERATSAGAEVTMPLGNQFWGDRYGKLKDPFGHEWSIASHVEDVSPAELKKRAAAAFGEGCGEKK